jgi:hypothetical protein
VPAGPEVTSRRAGPSLNSSKLTAIALQPIVSLKRASEISTLSEDTIRRRYPDKIVKLSPRRSGMRVRDALLLGDTE